MFGHQLPTAYQKYFKPQQDNELIIKYISQAHSYALIDKHTGVLSKLANSEYLLHKLEC